MNAFMLLTWREWRRDRPIFFAALAIVPMLALLVLVGVARERHMSSWDAIRRFLEIAPIIALMMGVVFMPLLAAHAVAGERADRSARFVAALPVTRGCRLSAKVVTLLGPVLLLWGPFLTWLVLERPSPPPELGICATLTLLTTAFAWLLAAWLDTVVVAAGLAILIPVAVPLLVQHFPELTGFAESEDRAAFFGLWLRSDYAPTLLTLLVAAGLFAAGTAIYLRRAE